MCFFKGNPSTFSRLLENTQSWLEPRIASNFDGWWFVLSRSFSFSVPSTTRIEKRKEGVCRKYPVASFKLFAQKLHGCGGDKCDQLPFSTRQVFPLRHRYL